MRYASLQRQTRRDRRRRSQMRAMVLRPTTNLLHAYISADQWVLRVCVAAHEHCAFRAGGSERLMTTSAPRSSSIEKCKKRPSAGYKVISRRKDLVARQPSSRCVFITLIYLFISVKCGVSFNYKVVVWFNRWCGSYTCLEEWHDDVKININ